MAGLRHLVASGGMALLLGMTIMVIPAFGADRLSSPPEGLSADEALRLGERMYRDGVLPSGDPMKAVVEGDIPVEGSMFTCANCHMRSGLGSNEGTVITPPTNGAKLYRSRKAGQEFSEIQRKHLPYYFQVPDSRPAYTDRTLAEVLRSGIDPSGYRLDPLMPRYPFDERDMDVMVYYLKNLSSVPSPGVSETTIRFATIVGPGVSRRDRDAMVLPLQAYMRDRSVRQEYYEARTRHERFAEEMDRSARKLLLSVWELKGPPDTWERQLEEHYRREPVFAILGGIVLSRWSAVHAFCERNRIPCILPVTDQPVISDSSWYTLYFSKGPYQEGETAARFTKVMVQGTGDRPVVQVYRKTHEAVDIATGFREGREKLGLPRAEEIVFPPEQMIPDGFWEDLSRKYENGILALWLDSDDLSRLQRTPAASSRTVMASATILGDGMYRLPGEMRKYTYVMYPQRLPADSPGTTMAVKQWLKVKKIPDTNFSISSKMYFMGTVLTEVFMHMQRNYYRDHFLDVFDMLQDQTYTIADYPRLSFGPGQRYASKGCYVVQLSSGENPEIIRKSDWVIH